MQITYKQIPSSCNNFNVTFNKVCLICVVICFPILLELTFSDNCGHNFYNDHQCENAFIKYINTRERMFQIHRLMQSKNISHKSQTDE